MLSRSLIVFALITLSSCGSREHRMRPTVSRSSRLWWQGIAPEPSLSTDDWQRDRFLEDKDPQRDRIMNAR